MMSIMKSYVCFSVECLQDAGYKITESRQTILEFLSKSQKALSPYEIQDLLKRRGIKADVVTIYRVLELFEKLNLVHKILAVNGYVRCHTEQIKKPQACHHYLVCKNCQSVEEVEGENLAPLEKKIVKNYCFDIASHYLEFTGLCAKCRKSKK